VHNVSNLIGCNRLFELLATGDRAREAA